MCDDSLPPYVRMEGTVKDFFAKIIAYTGVGLFYVIMLGMLPGWAWWMWMAIHLGSFGMFFVGILGPFAFIPALIGLWSLLFGIPDWLLYLVT